MCSGGEKAGNIQKFIIYVVKFNNRDTLEYFRAQRRELPCPWGQKRLLGKGCPS